MTTLRALLADQGIRPRRLDPGSTSHIDCHRCCVKAGDDKGSLSVTIDADGSGAVWICHRGSCAWTDSVKLPRDRPPPSQQSARPPRPAQPTPSEQPDWFWAFWTARNIGASTVRALGVKASTRHFPALGGRRDCIVFPYLHRGQQVGAKYRAYPEKQHSQDPPDPPTLYNADSIKPGATLVWVEGEPDALACHEVNEPRVVSFKDGAPAPGASVGKRFLALETHADALAKVKRHIICTDTDAPGDALAEALSLRLGRHRCNRWVLPDGCKDACDVLVRHGTDALLAAIRDAQPYPVEGIRTIPLDYSETLFNRPPPTMMSTGVRALDDILRLPADGRLITLTGQTNHGKSTFLRWLIQHTIRCHDRNWLAFVAEDDFDSAVIELVEMITERPFRQSTPEARREATAILSRGLKLVDTEVEQPTIGSILDRAEAAMLHGLTDLAIDPWNELEHQRDARTTESDYVGKAIQRLKRFIKLHGVNVWIVAHPDKLAANDARKAKRPPDGHSIAGSMHFANKSDLGLSIMRGDNPGESEVHIWKSRSKRWGSLGAKMRLRFDPGSNCFLDPLADDNVRQMRNRYEREDN